MMHLSIAYLFHEIPCVQIVNKVKYFSKCCMSTFTRIYILNIYWFDKIVIENYDNNGVAQSET